MSVSPTFAAFFGCSGGGGPIVLPGDSKQTALLNGVAAYLQDEVFDAIGIQIQPTWSPAIDRKSMTGLVALASVNEIEPVRLTRARQQERWQVDVGVAMPLGNDADAACDSVSAAADQVRDALYGFSMLDTNHGRFRTLSVESPTDVDQDYIRQSRVALVTVRAQVRRG